MPKRYRIRGLAYAEGFEGVATIDDDGQLIVDSPIDGYNRRIEAETAMLMQAQEIGVEEALYIAVTRSSQHTMAPTE